MSTEHPVPPRGPLPQRLDLLHEGEWVRPESPNISRVLANNPELQGRWTPFANYILLKQSLPVRDRELAMLRIGWRVRAPYEWAGHVMLATRAGVTAEEIQRVAEGSEAGWTDHERAVLRAVDELVEDGTVSDETWATLAETYSPAQLLDLLFTIGQYNLVSWVVNSVGVPADEWGDATT
jgi:4-carboxymuconolactone decarboxylase